ncbi:MAG: InlB B-repeat-containing protein [Methanomassiliicoccaceae archaeon]|nr:InlB B-repeat-containing protein [Methanomassiliicoccaceae archaeon]
MICPNCGRYGYESFCPNCGAGLDPGRGAERPGDRRRSNALPAALAVALILVIASVGYYLITEERNPTVTLMSDGRSVGSVTVTKSGFVDIDQLETIESTLSKSGLHFAGWYTDPSFEDKYMFHKPENRYQKVKKGFDLYASWNELDMELTFTSGLYKSDPTYVKNQISCKFENRTSNYDTGTTEWTITDAFKTNVPSTDTGPQITFKGSDDDLTIDLRPGMYYVTMSADVGGETMSTTKAVTVKGEVVGNVKWDYNADNKDLEVTYSFDVDDYITFAKMNRGRDFRISNIASFVMWDIGPIKMIADELKELMEIIDPGMSPQDRINFIMIFLEQGDWKSDSDYYWIKGVPGLHPNSFSVEYYKYPAEALYDWILFGGPGDCDCKAILAAAVAIACGFDDVSVIVLTNPAEREGHAVAGIRDPGFVPLVIDLSSPTFFYQIDGYFACDTGGDFKLGELANKYKKSGWLIRAFAVA